VSRSSAAGKADKHTPRKMCALPDSWDESDSANNQAAGKAIDRMPKGARTQAPLKPGFPEAGFEVRQLCCRFTSSAQAELAHFQSPPPAPWDSWSPRAGARKMVFDSRTDAIERVDSLIFQTPVASPQSGGSPDYLDK